MKFFKFEGAKAVYPSFSGELPEGAIEVIANQTEAAFEKHIPEVKRLEEGLEVSVGSVLHPMLEAHYIQWIGLLNGDSFTVKMLAPGQEPKAFFETEELCENAEVFEFCNLHGLWSKKI